MYLFGPCSGTDHGGLPDLYSFILYGPSSVYLTIQLNDFLIAVVPSGVQVRGACIYIYFLTWSFFSERVLMGKINAKGWEDR